MTTVLRVGIIWAIATTVWAQAPTVDFTTQVFPIFSQAGCTGCHGSSGGFAIGADAATAYNKLTTGPWGNCGKAYIVAGDTTASFLYDKIAHASPSCGERMPKGNPSYFDTNTDQLNLIRTWILEGAPADTGVIAILPGKPLPSAFVLEQNYPNPFNPATTIVYSIPEPAFGSLVVRNLRWQVVKTLVNEWQGAGTHTVEWAGSDDSGAPVSSGVYFCHLQVGRWEATRRMVLIR